MDPRSAYRTTRFFDNVMVLVTLLRTIQNGSTLYGQVAVSCVRRT
jgi:hypothetical protein